MSKSGGATKRGGMKFNIDEETAGYDWRLNTISIGSRAASFESERTEDWGIGGRIDAKFDVLLWQNIITWDKHKKFIT